MEEATGEPMGPVPDVYMVGNRVTLDTLSQATLVNLGWQGGYYRSFSFKPGIYILADKLRTGLERVLVHEYVHHVVDGITGDETVPNWLNEGLAEFYETDLGRERPRPNAFALHRFRTADNAKLAAQSETLFPLAELESNREWNERSEPDRIRLQYDQSYMIIRFMNETFGESSPFDALREIASGAELAEALNSVVGLTYEDFEARFVDWISKWEDPVTTEATDYFQVLDQIMELRGSISERRRTIIQQSLSDTENVAAYTGLVTDAQEAVKRLASITPPPIFENIHADATVFFDLNARWITLELEYWKTFDGTHQNKANGLLPEVNARTALLFRGISDSKWVLNLP